MVIIHSIVKTKDRWEVQIPVEPPYNEVQEYLIGGSGKTRMAALTDFDANLLIAGKSLEEVYLQRLTRIKLSYACSRVLINSYKFLNRLELPAPVQTIAEGMFDWTCVRKGKFVLLDDGGFLEAGLTAVKTSRRLEERFGEARSYEEVLHRHFHDAIQYRWVSSNLEQSLISYDHKNYLEYRTVITLELYRFMLETVKENLNLIGD